jgi:uncharacterized phage protein (TIGR02218 family)
MRTIPDALAAELQSGATTLCRCWRAMRRDGRVFGFTDHDRDLAFGATTYKAATGVEATEAESLLGLAIGGGEIAGALQAEALTEADIEAGLWDGAAVETWLVDWRDVTRRMLLDAGTIGEIRRQGYAFAAEVRTLAQALDQGRGRRYQALCPAELGDARCGVDLSHPSRRADAIIGVADGASFVVPGLPAFAAGAFSGGLAAFSSGANMGLSGPILGHARNASQETITLWEPPPHPLAAGDSVTLTVGCDKTFSTCRDRFANAVNFRGFPHIPGNDFVATYARQGEPGQDGGAIAP